MRPRKTKLKRNKRGTFTKEIGYLNPVKKSQPKFNLGTDEKDAEVRQSRIMELFEDCTRILGKPMWTSFALYAAKLIAKGKYQIPYAPQWEVLNYIWDDPSVEDKCAEYVQMLRVEQARYPSIQIIASDHDMYDYGVALNSAYENVLINKMDSDLKELGVIPHNRKASDKLISGTLHEALDAYIEIDIKKSGLKLEDGTLKFSQRKRIQYAKTLKEQHLDQSLMELSSYDAVAQLHKHWQNRPEYEPGKRYKTTSALHRYKELVRFLKWLNLTTEFQWEMPRGADQIKINFVEFESDHQNVDLLRKNVYTPEQLGLIASYASDMDLLLLYVGVNCAFGAAEIGRLIVGDILLNHKHEYAERLHFETTSRDSFVRLIRPKSKMFGEWLLWPETAEILKWAIERAKKLGTPYIVSRSTGSMLYQEQSQNPQAGFANRWSKLIKRVQKDHPEFPHLPYGSLRDTLPDTLRHQKADNLASICLAHKTAYKPDNLLDAYGNKPFGRLHTAIRELHDYFKPMFHSK